VRDGTITEAAGAAAPERTDLPEPRSGPEGGGSPPRSAPAPDRAPSTPGPDTGDQVRRWGLPLAVVVIGMFMSVLDTSIVNVAIPAMQKEYGAAPDDIEWVATAYTLCLGVIVPTSAWLGERLGLRRLYLWSLLGFAVFSALCGTAANLDLMIVYRILQAVPGGLIPVTCLSMITRMVPPRQMGAAMGAYGLGIVVAPGVGPALGGYLVQYVDWRLIFFINVPVALLGAAAALAVLPELPGNAGRPFDTAGFACCASGLFAILLAVSEGRQWGWTSYPTLILAAASASLLALFVVIELHSDHPMLDVRVFVSPVFVNAMVLVAVLSIGFFATLYFIPTFLQNGQKITPMHTGLTVLPQAVVMMIIMPWAGKAYDRFGARWPAAAGLLVAGSGIGMMAAFNPDMTRGQVVLWTCVQAAGMAIAFVPVMTAGLATLAPSVTEAGNAYTNLVQRVAGALGIPVFTALTTAWQAQDFADRSALLRGTGANANPELLAMQRQGPSGLIPLWQQTHTATQALSYGNAFLLLGVVTILSALLAVFLPEGRPDPGQRSHVELA
jgi:EmrB/QacA subfamily drug resistance transporter